MSETFLNRWARRKAEARQHDDDPEAEAAAAAEEQADAVDLPDAAAADEPPDEETKQRWIAELEEVDIDALSYDDDFAVYMKDWVPAGLRQKALRKLWTSHPTLACLDGLNDYEEDFTDAGTVVANMKSDWLPGRGYKFLDSLEAEKPATAPAEETPAGHDAPEAPADEAHLAEVDDAGEPQPSAQAPADVAAEADEDEEPDSGAPDKTA